MSGSLYIVGSPIGNLEDITLRALRILQEVDQIYAEDTRVTHKLLERYQLSKPLHSFREAAPRLQVERVLRGIIEDIQAGQSIAYLSDAGTPGISDPGQYLIEKCVEHGLQVIPIPGPSALTSLISVSGLPAARILFIGFIPKKKGHQTELEQIKRLFSENLIDGVLLYESPERILKLLAEFSRFEIPLSVCLGREMTKHFEEFMRGSLSDVQAMLSKKTSIKGEISLIITYSR